MGHEAQNRVMRIAYKILVGMLAVKKPHEVQ